MTKGISDRVFADMMAIAKDAGIGLLEILKEPTNKHPHTDSAEEAEKLRCKKLQNLKGIRR